jgi:hypothetical protein
MPYPFLIGVKLRLWRAFDNLARDIFAQQRVIPKKLLYRTDLLTHFIW